jgi:two-component system alkaline phosphatase synthesis response regulator PhoP
MPDKKKLLIVDDEQDLCELLKRKFEICGFEVLTANGGESGFQKAVEFFPDCVVLDIRMEQGDGLTFLRWLRAFRHDNIEIEEKIRKTPVIVLTAAGDGMKPIFELEGANDYAQKPFDSNDLKARILKLIDGAGK